jgi:MFS family permease
MTDQTMNGVRLDAAVCGRPDQPTLQFARADSFRDVWLITIGHTLTHWYPATFYLLLPLIGQELGLSYVQIGSILSFQAVASALSNVPGGLLADAISRKGLLMALSLFWVGAPYLLMGFSREYWLLLGCAALVGIGNNLWHPTAIPLLARRFPDRRGLVVSIHGMGGHVGDAVAPLVVGAMLAVVNWRDVVVLNVIPGVLMSCAILVCLGGLQSQDVAQPRREKPAARGQLLRDFGRLLTNRTVVLLSTSSAFRAMTQSALLTFLPVYLAAKLGYSPAAIGACLFAMQAAGFAAAPIAGHLSDKMGRRRIIISSMAMSGVILLAMVFAGQSATFVFLVAFLGLFLFAIRAVLQAWLLDATPPNMGGSSIGVMFGTQAVGAAVGPVVAGLLADGYGLLAAFYFCALTIIVANMFILFTHAPGEPVKAAAVAD